MSFSKNSNACLIPSKLRKIDFPFYHKNSKILYFISLYSVRNLYSKLENNTNVFYTKPLHSTNDPLRLKCRVS